MATPHVLAIPYPAQGHVIPLMEVSLWLVRHGIKVTFVNTEFNHQRVVKALTETENTQEKERVKLVSIPDGLEPWEDRNELGKLSKVISTVMPGKLEDLIEKINGTESDKIMCIIADYGMGWASELAKKLGIKSVAFCPAAAAMLALANNCLKLIDDGIIDGDGRVLKKQMFQLSPAMPLMNSETLGSQIAPREGSDLSFLLRIRRDFPRTPVQPSSQEGILVKEEIYSHQESITTRNRKIRSNKSRTHQRETKNFDGTKET
ncbi:UDP-glycosyltransferase 83A1-like [Olea europaea var. sylvestris]|uniref:UDP-glycosyltransferase 83A1-like n=1 Tax=Olea europaea var. sylvestris TaxID=158386 RepID=UPI000C1D2F7D|nr:UDP-glycosyltransferase 83A1-like [Olea europaea var. sylvestris]